MARLESEAYMLERMAIMGIADLHAEMKVRGWGTLGGFAFSCAYQPGAGPEDAFITGVVQPLVGNGASKIPGLRRLYFEAHTLAAADMRRRVEATGDDPPQKLPNVERERRREMVQDQLKGLETEFEGLLDPSNDLIDRACDMEENNELVYIKWHQCSTRAQEISQDKRPTLEEFKPDANGFLKVTRSSEASPAQLGSDLRLRYALQRRGIALQMANVMHYKVHDLLVTRLFKEVMSPPLDGRHEPCSLEQARRADEWVFKALARKCRRGIWLDPDGALPAGRHLLDLLKSFEFTSLLSQLPTSGGAKRKQESQGDDDADGLSKGQKRRKAKQAARALSSAGGSTTPPPPTQTWTQRAATSDKGKGAGKGKAKGPRMPAELVGLQHQTQEGEPICFSYNLANGCSNASPGARCPRGVHVCCKCGAKHSFSAKLC